MSSSNDLRQGLRAVFFDLDGTLIDSINHIVDCWQYTIRTTLGREMAREEILPNVGRTLIEAFESVAPGRGEELMLAYKAHQALTHDTEITLVPGTLETLEGLRSAGLRLGVVTSKGIKIATQGLGLFGLVDAFEVLVTLEDTARHKPFPDPVLAGCERMGVQPHEAVYVGDATWDIEAGKAAGAHTAGVTWGASTPEEIAAAGPDWIFNEMTDALQLAAARVG